METVSAKELSKKKIDGITVAKPYGDLLGEIELKAVCLIWGENGGGKSTFALGLANVLAEYGRVEYIPSEENFGKTLIDRVNRLKAYHENLHFSRYKSLEELKKWLKDVNAKVVFIDSISVLSENSSDVVSFAQWCRNNDIGFYMVAHANKDNTYKGESLLAHETDINIEVLKENGMAQARKNRYQGELKSIPVPFQAKDITSGSGKTAKNDPADDPKPRENPVKTPFTVTLKELDRLHKIRSIKKLNSYVGHKHPCYMARHSGEKADSHISFKYDPDYPNRKYTLDLLLDGQVEYTACAEGESQNFIDAWKEIVSKYGDLEIEIRSQDHAKKVLGAREYKKQERRQAKKGKKSGKPKKKKKRKSKAAGKKPVKTEAIVKSGSDELPKDRKNLVFRQLHSMDTGRPMGVIGYGRHDGTIEGIQGTAHEVSLAADASFGHKMTHAGSPIFATDETGQVKWAISPNLKTVAEINTEKAVQMYGKALEQFGIEVDDSELPGMEKPKKKKKTKPKKKSKPAKSSKSKQRKAPKKKKTKSKKSGTAKIDIAAAKKQQQELKSLFEGLMDR